MVVMNNLEQNALRIAELIGYKKVLDMYCKNGQSFHEHKIETFSSYNGLMPIVFECNKSDIDYPININPSQVRAYPGDGLDIYSYNTESEFTEALQQAVIKYLELKNEY